MLYTSMNISLAYLENLVHFNDSDVPPNLYITSIQLNEKALNYHLPDNKYPPRWQEPGNIENKKLGDD